MAGLGEVRQKRLAGRLSRSFFLIDQFEHQTAFTGFKFSGVERGFTVYVVLLVCSRGFGFGGGKRRGLGFGFGFGFGGGKRRGFGGGKRRGLISASADWRE